MWERDLAAKPANILHMPHVARSIIKLRPENDTAQQEILRSLTVRHVLGAALRETGRLDRGLLIPTLLGMRDEPPFKKIREILAEDRLLIMRSNTQSEQKALNVVREIRRLAGAKAGQDQLRFARESALRAIGQVRADDFERNLYRVFPELQSIGASRH